MIERRILDITRPAHGPMDLNAGRPNAKDALYTGGFTLISLAVGAIGALVVVWALPLDVYATWSALRVIGCVFGGLVGFFGLSFAWNMGRITIEEWRDYQGRKSEWHSVQIRMYERANGLENIREYSSLELRPELARDVLALGLALHWRYVNGANARRDLHSVRSLEESVYLDGGNRAILIGKLSGTAPEKVSALFAKLGWVRNRRPGYAGDWAPESFDDVINLFTRNWSKVDRSQHDE